MVAQYGIRAILRRSNRGKYIYNLRRNLGREIIDKIAGENQYIGATTIYQLGGLAYDTGIIAPITEMQILNMHNFSRIARISRLHL